MNCKQGDLAIFVGRGVNCGRMVRCISPLPAGFDGLPAKNGPRWRIDRLLAKYVMGGLVEAALDHIADKFLLPIRPPGEDEHEDCDEPVTIDAER